MRLEKTCDACPEQYDVYKKDRCVGYLRLRHGYFSAEAFTTNGNQIVYEAYVNGDGIFDDDERDFHLKTAKKAIKKALKKDKL
jgi:hypothetical protein